MSVRMRPSLPHTHRRFSPGWIPLPLLLAGAIGLVAPVELRGSAAEPPPPKAGQPPTPPPPGRETGMISIESDSQQADNRTGIVTATGNVRIVYPDRGMVATSRQAQYFSKEGRLVLTGDVDVIDHDGQRIRAERLVYRLDSERLVAEPPSGRQVYSKMLIQEQPAAGTPTPPAAPSAP